MKAPLCLVVCAMLARIAVGEGPSSPSISQTFPPPEDVRKPDLTIPDDSARPNALVAYNPNGRFLATGGADGVIRIYDAWSGDRLSTNLAQILTGHTFPILAIGFNDTNILISVSQDETAKMWDVISGKLLHGVELNFGKQLVPAIAPGREPFFAGGTLKQVRLWNYQTGELLRSFEANDSNVAALTFTPDGKSLVIGTVKGVVRVMDVAAWKVTRSIDLDTPVRSLAASRNHIAVGYADGSVALLNFADQASIPEVRTRQGRVLAVTFSPKGELFATTGADQTLKVWNTETLKLLGTQQGHSGEVVSVSFSPNGQKMASGSADGSVNCSTVPVAVDDTPNGPKTP